MKLIGAGLVAFLVLYFADHHYANGRFTHAATLILKRVI
jgi:hypothetical protein